MPSPKRNKTVLSVRVWKRQDRKGFFWVTVKRPGQKPVTKSTGSAHRATAEDYADLLFKQLTKPTKPQVQESVQQLDFTPPPHGL